MPNSSIPVSCLALLFALSALACHPLPAQSGTQGNQSATSSDVAAIRAIRAELNLGLVRRDTGLIARHWVPNVVATGYAGVTTTGRDAQVQNFARIFADSTWGGGLRTPTSIEVSPDLGSAAEQGEFVWRQTTGPAARTITGRYLVVWVRVQGEWRIRGELYGATRCEGAGCIPAPARNHPVVVP